MTACDRVIELEAAFVWPLEDRLHQDHPLSQARPYRDGTHCGPVLDWVDGINFRFLPHGERWKIVADGVMHPVIDP